MNFKNKLIESLELEHSDALTNILEANEGYAQILKKYLEYIDENNTKSYKNVYDFIYDKSTLAPYTRKLINEHWASYKCIKQIASDLEITLEINFKTPLILNQTCLDSEDFLSNNGLKKCFYIIYEYKDDHKLNKFLNIFYENFKPLGINTSIKIEKEV